MQSTCSKIDSNNTAAIAVLHDQIDCEIFNVKFCVVLERLLVQRMQHRMSGPISRGTSSLRGALTVTRRHTAEWALVNLAILGA